MSYTLERDNDRSGFLVSLRPGLNNCTFITALLRDTSKSNEPQGTGIGGVGSVNIAFPTL
ncbi:hypothetical protein [Microcoleus sp. F4-D5]|uniref:hypothetical protein n=1 Tax=Microcoleus sp. F4-D5 TaxID=2818760 RepID=UPI002FD0D695